MKKLVFIFSLFMASISYANSPIEILEKNQTIEMSNNVESKCSVVESNKPLDCEFSTTSTVTTNPDGSTTRTTRTIVSCDTPQELAELHKLMSAIGMGV